MYEKLDDGVYILHETLGVRDVEGWNSEDNDGVVGVLVVEDEHQIVVALEDSPEDIRWSNRIGLVNQPVEDFEDIESDFNGEEYCRKLNSPEYPAAYYCLNYKKGGLSWYLPSSGELWLICRHLEEIQTALTIVGGQKFVTIKRLPLYWSSSEHSDLFAHILHFNIGIMWRSKNFNNYKVRPVSNFNQLLKHGNNKCEKRVVRFN